MYPSGVPLGPFTFSTLKHALHLVDAGGEPSDAATVREHGTAHRRAGRVEWLTRGDSERRNQATMEVEVKLRSSPPGAILLPRAGEFVEFRDYSAYGFVVTEVTHSLEGNAPGIQVWLSDTEGKPEVVGDDDLEAVVEMLHEQGWQVLR